MRKQRYRLAPSFTSTLKHVVGEKAVAPSSWLVGLWVYSPPPHQAKCFVGGPLGVLPSPSTLKSGVEEKRGVQLCPLHTLDPSSASTLECRVGVKGLFIVFCVGGSKELAVLYGSYSTAAFVLQQGFVLYK